MLNALSKKNNGKFLLILFRTAEDKTSRREISDKETFPKLLIILINLGKCIISIIFSLFSFGRLSQKKMELQLRNVP